MFSLVRVEFQTLRAYWQMIVILDVEKKISSMRDFLSFCVLFKSYRNELVLTKLTEEFWDGGYWNQDEIKALARTDFWSNTQNVQQHMTKNKTIVIDVYSLSSAKNDSSDCGSMCSVSVDLSLIQGKYIGM